MRKVGVLSPRQSVRIGIYPTEKKARQRLLKQQRRAQIREATYHTLPNRQGHPEKFYTIDVRKDLKHAAELSEVLISLSPEDIRTGQDVNPMYLADAEITIAGEPYCLENDRDTHNEKGLMKHMQKVSQFPGIVLWIAATQTRLTELMRVGKAIGRRFIFALFSDVVERTWDEIWWTSGGERFALPRGSAT